MPTGSSALRAAKSYSTARPEAFDLEAENAVYRFDQDVEEAPDLRRELDPHVVHDLDKALKRGLKRGKETETAIGSESGGGAQ
ncbi:MAG TPA: hypothetical protein PKD27_02695 [Tepidiformaceae bacterium]|nr:hypothetical protein [Tepidiformaceae bacterium]